MTGAPGDDSRLGRILLAPVLITIAVAMKIGETIRKIKYGTWRKKDEE